MKKEYLNYIEKVLKNEYKEHYLKYEIISENEILKLEDFISSFKKENISLYTELNLYMMIYKQLNHANEYYKEHNYKNNMDIFNRILKTKKNIDVYNKISENKNNTEKFSVLGVGNDIENYGKNSDEIIKHIVLELKDLTDIGFKTLKDELGHFYFLPSFTKKEKCGIIANNKIDNIELSYLGFYAFSFYQTDIPPRKFIETIVKGNRLKVDEDKNFNYHIEDYFAL